MTCEGRRASKRAAVKAPKPAPTMTTRWVRLLAIVSAYKIRSMAVGSKSFPRDVPSEPWVSNAETGKGTGTVQSSAATLLQIALGYILIEVVLWTPLGRFHTGVMLVVTVRIFLFDGCCDD